MLCVCQGLWKGVCCFCICVHVLPSLKPTYNPAAENTPLGTMGKAAGAKANKVTKATGCKPGRKVVDSSIVTVAALAMPFRNLMNYRKSEKCQKAANHVLCETQHRIAFFVRLDCASAPHSNSQLQ